MNERIKELAEQAGEEAIKSVPFFRTGRCQIPAWVNVFIEVRDKKFAELIVRECNFKLDNIGVIDRDSRTIAMKVISEHFGVE